MSEPASHLVIEPWQAPNRFYRETTSANYNADGSVNLDSAAGPSDLYVCAEIGALSDLGSILMFTDGDRPTPPQSTSGYIFDPMVNAKVISVDRPWVGEFHGPIALVPMNAGWRLSGTRDPSAVGTLRLDLLLHRTMPLHVAKRRPDGLYRSFVTLASGSVAEAALLTLPAFGREDILINLLSTISTSGTIVVKIYGVTAALGLASKFLLDTVTVTTAGALVSSREYEGKFDTYYFTVTTTSMADAASTLDLHVRTRDKF